VGCYPLVILGCLGSCLDWYSICLPVCGLLEGEGVPQSGRWCAFLPFFDVYGGRETIGALWTFPSPRRTFCPLVFILCIFGL
jgi:hypothetical protein